MFFKCSSGLSRHFELFSMRLRLLHVAALADEVQHDGRLVAQVLQAAVELWREEHLGASSEEKRQKSHQTYQTEIDLNYITSYIYISN